MSLRHQQIAVTNTRHSAAALGSAMDGDEFANVISLADLGPGWFACVFEILRSEADRDKRENVRFVTDLRSAVNDDVRLKTNAVSDLYV
jgi:hypothetical protein